MCDVATLTKIYTVVNSTVTILITYGIRNNYTHPCAMITRYTFHGVWCMYSTRAGSILLILTW